MTKRLIVSLVPQHDNPNDVIIEVNEIDNSCCGLVYEFELPIETMYRTYLVNESSDFVVIEHWNCDSLIQAKKACKRFHRGFSNEIYFFIVLNNTGKCFYFSVC